MLKPSFFVRVVLYLVGGILFVLITTFCLVANGATRLVLLGIMYRRTFSIDKFYPQPGVSVELATDTYRTLIKIWFALAFLDWVPFDIYAIYVVSRRSSAHLMMVLFILLALTAMISGSLLHKSVSRASNNWTGYNYKPLQYQNRTLAYDKTRLESFDHYFGHYTPLLVLQSLQVTQIVGFYLLAFWLPSSFRLPKDYRPLLHSPEVSKHSSSTENVSEGPIKMLWSQQELGRGIQEYTVPVEADNPRSEKQLVHLANETYRWYNYFHGQQPNFSDFLRSSPKCNACQQAEWEVSHRMRRHNDVVILNGEPGTTWPRRRTSLRMAIIAGFVGIALVSVHIAIQFARLRTGATDRELCLGKQWEIVITHIYPFLWIPATITAWVIHHLRISPTARVLLGFSIEHLVAIYMVPVLTLSALAVILTSARISCVSGLLQYVWTAAVGYGCVPWIFQTTRCLILLYDVFSPILGRLRSGPVSGGSRFGHVLIRKIGQNIRSFAVATALLFAFGTDERDIRRCTTKVVDAYKPAQARTRLKTSEDSKASNVE